MIDIKSTALLDFLRSRYPEYFGKILEFRETIEDWLSYIPQTFPHYTRHTIRHSDEIVRQLSQILFIDGDSSRPSLEGISGIEAYILVAAAYFHDAGMVVSDHEKLQILLSSEWKEWTTNGGGTKRWRDIEAFRLADSSSEPSIRNFLADIQVRHLIAEFVRRTHHLRAGELLAHNQSQLGRFAFDDPLLERTIADVCISHGLRQHQLSDSEKFPERRDLRGEKANVRLLALLLRIGDLLDMSHDRACPLLMNAACPLPAESLAHWTQYQRLNHRLIANDKIELVAECLNQDEHRFLYDWCQWLVKELAEISVAMPRAERHRNWQPPLASIEGDAPTIKIRPAASATYIPSSWIFELDRDAIFQRLIVDTYEHPLVFVRELVQNAADANRCQMYLDMMRDGVDLPKYPTQAPADYRQRYPIYIGMAQRERQNYLSGETERRQAIIVDDVGLGMDRDVIERYFLQVGRSFYATQEFRRNFQFIPTSRFGIGFLSTFAVSDEILVETYKPTSDKSPDSLLLKLVGPRSYLLTERGTRRRSGTRVEVVLKQSLDSGVLTKLVRGWFRRLEFPIILEASAEREVIEAEKVADFVSEVPDFSESGNVLAIRSFPLSAEGIEGELYIFTRVSGKGESWIHYNWAKYKYVKEYPEAIVPEMPGNLRCLHGVTIDDDPFRMGSGAVTRLDLRGSQYDPTLSRASQKGWPMEQRMPLEVQLGIREIIKRHLADSAFAAGDAGWIYRQELMDIVGDAAFWDGLAGTIRVVDGKEPKLVSLTELLQCDPIRTVVGLQKGAMPLFPLARDAGVPMLWAGDIASLSERVRLRIFHEKGISSIGIDETGRLLFDWRSIGSGAWVNWSFEDRMFIADFGADGVSAIKFFPIKGSSGTMALNRKTPFCRWFLRVKSACEGGANGLRRGQFGQLAELVLHAMVWGSKERELAKYVDGWRRLVGLPPDLLPPPRDLIPGGESFLTLRL